MFRPGMSVTAEIETRYRTNVLAVPIQSVTTRVPKKKEVPAADSSGVGVTPNGETSPKNGTDKKDSQKPIEVVFALEGEHVKVIPVKRGISDDAFVEITEGVDENIAVISGGYKAINRELEDGKRVKVGPPEERVEKPEN